MRPRPLRPPLGFSGLLLLAGLGCGVVGFVNNASPLTGLSYWAAETATPVPTVTIFLGTSTPVYADTPVPGLITTTPFGLTSTPLWVTTTPVSPVTTTPGLPLIGYTTPEPTETPYYRIGTFYMHSDVYVGGPSGLVFRVIDRVTQSSPRDAAATYHFITVRVKNYTADEIIAPVSDIFFIRHVEQGGNTVGGRWTAQNEPLIARGLPAYETQQLEAIPADGQRDIVLGFVVPNGNVRELGMITNWNRPVEGGMPIWFFLEPDPLGPFNDAYRPPPPTAVVLDDGGSQVGAGMWPTTGIVTRGFGCNDLYTGIDGTGFGCPPTRRWFHNGVDIANTAGTLIWSPIDATMRYAGPNSTGPDCSNMAGSQPPHEGLGNYQRLGDGHTLHYFGHLSGFLVNAGNVTAGQNVAHMGSTGCSTGSHLHWMMYQNGSLIDPSQWAGPGPSP
jgi:murein DD-endopeptidase MepM/ murein hydrolase activator NlpD